LCDGVRRECSSRRVRAAEGLDDVPVKHKHLGGVGERIRRHFRQKVGDPGEGETEADKRKGDLRVVGYCYRELFG